MQALAIRPDGIYIDGTFGRGGHSQRISSALGDEGRLLAFDRTMPPSPWRRHALPAIRASPSCTAASPQIAAEVARLGAAPAY